jgi:hypothetical protein
MAPKFTTQKLGSNVEGLCAIIRRLDGRFISGNPAPEVIDALRGRGREYAAIPRPKGFRRQMEKKECFHNAFTKASKRKEARYVEDLAFTPVPCIWLPHAWLTIDGVNAIDQTWPYVEGIRYFGIELPFKEVAGTAARRGWIGSALAPDDWWCA